MSEQIITYLILFVYFGLLFVIGLFASRRIKGLNDYFVGGKNLGYWVVAFSSRATGESAWLLLGLTGMGAMIGVQAFWVVLGELLGVFVAWFLMAKPFKQFTDDYQCITIPDYLVSRFQTTSHLLRKVAASTLAIFVIIYVSAQIDATGAAFETFLDWNYYVGALVGFAIVIGYIVFGGFVAVAWSDLFQGLIMLAGLVLLPVVAYFSLDTTVPIMDSLRSIDPALTSVWGGEGFSLLSLTTIFGLSMIGLGFMGAPQVFVRFMSIKGQGEIRKGRWVAMAFTLITDGSAVCIGIIGRILFTKSGADPESILGNGAQDVLSRTVELVMPHFIVGIYIAAVLAAIMSTIDSLLVVASSAVVRDFYQQIYHPDLKQESMSKLSRIVTIIMALIALAIAMVIAINVPGRTVFWFVVFGWSGIAATFCPVIILSLFWKGYTEAGAITSMITGFLAVIFFKFVAPRIDGVGIYFSELAELFPSFVLAMLTGFIVSKLKKADQKTSDVK